MFYKKIVFSCYFHSGNRQLPLCKRKRNGGKRLSGKCWQSQDNSNLISFLKGDRYSVREGRNGLRDGKSEWLFLPHDWIANFLTSIANLFALYPCPHFLTFVTGCNTPVVLYPCHSCCLDSYPCCFTMKLKKIIFDCWSLIKLRSIEKNLQVYCCMPIE